MRELALIFYWLVEWGWVVSLLVLWVGLWRVGVTACRVSPRGGRAFLGAGVLPSGSWWEAVKQKVAPGVAGLVARDGAAGVAGDDGGDARQSQVDRPGLSGGGGGQQACGPGPRSGTR